ncbi:MAG TPA: hypothetical protein VMV72_02425 [Verrucomicrobiae bacterium]|nr:hypothetical protein [Verrucomicrobiae bacterium]
MATTVTILDEATAGGKTGEFRVELASSRVTVRELIRSRVEQEVRQYNQSTPGCFRGLVQPREAEVTLNGYKLRKQRQIDAEDQVARAVEAFENHRILVLVDDRQVDNLDEGIDVNPETTVSFVKLVPLVGG